VQSLYLTSGIQGLNQSLLSVAHVTNSKYK
jgi:hypothetical protein